MSVTLLLNNTDKNLHSCGMSAPAEGRQEVNQSTNKLCIRIVIAVAHKFFFCRMISLILLWDSHWHLEDLKGKVKLGIYIVTAI